MSVVHLLEQNPLFFTEQNEAYPYWEKVHKQAVIHTRRASDDDRNHIIDDHRPHETNVLKNYRTKHEYQFTRAGFEMFLAKVSKAVKQSIQNTSSVSARLQAWMDSNPFLYLGEQMSLDAFVLDVVAKKALENPNELLLAFPYRKSNPSLPPIEGDSNVLVDIKPLIIPYQDIRYVDGDTFSFHAGQVDVLYDGSHISAAMYFSADSQYWYQHTPYYQKVDNRPVLKYSTRIWYHHDTGESLLNYLCGEYTCSRDESVNFLESYIRAYYSLSDAAMSAFSDEFIVNSRYSYPIPEIRPTKCHVPRCEGGYIDADHSKPCGECVKGFVLWPGPSGALVSPDDSHNVLDEKSSNKPAIQWHNPEMGFAKHAYERAFDLLDKAYQSIGLRLYRSAGAGASGDALREWKEDEQDKVHRVIVGLYQTIDRFLYQCESLLTPSRESRIRPKTIIPERITNHDLTELKAQAEKALPEDRLFAHKMYLKKKYGDDPIMAKAHDALLCYTPYMYEDLEVIKLNMTKDICTKDDMIKRQWGAIALDYVVDTMGQSIIHLSKEKIHEIMDAWFRKKGLITESGKQEKSKKDKTKEIQSLIKLSEAVQSGTISEQAAELLLVKSLGYDADDAQVIIEKVSEGAEAKIDEEETLSKTNKERRVKDILHGYIVRAIPKEDAINQLSALTRKPLEEIEEILKKNKVIR